MDYLSHSRIAARATGSATALLVVVLAMALHEPAPPPRPSTAASGLREELAALAVACRAYGAEDCAGWTVFSKLPPAVLVTRPTGYCGGCGTQVVAVLFENGTARTHAELGTFGRFGNGPDAAESLTLAGRGALMIDWSESQGGYSYSYRRLYWIDEDTVVPGLCVQTSFSNRGALEETQALEWDASMHVRPSGAIELEYRVTHRGEQASNISLAQHIPAALADADSECIGPD